jgi:hypothetical protein
MPAETTTDSNENLTQTPAFFIVGVPGSGTTRLQQLLDAQPAFAVAPDLHQITRYYQTRGGLDREGLIAAPMIRKWIEQNRFTPFGLGRDDIAKLVPADRTIPYSEFIARLLDQYGSARGKQRVASRSLDFARFLPDVHALWPHAKIIQLIRDGRDVCLTLLAAQTATQWLRRLSTWDSDSVGTIAFWWAWRLREARQAGRALGPEYYLEIRYESFRDDLVTVCSRLEKFLGLAVDHRLFGFDGDRGELDPEDPMSITDWRKQMAPQDAERFDAAAGELLDELGYERAPNPPSTQTLMQGRALRDRLAQEVAGPSFEALASYRTTNGRTNPFVFVVGCPRSGTTLLQRILDAHPAVAICDETFWIPYFFKRRIGLSSDGMVTPELISRLFDYYKFYRMKAGRDELKSLCVTERPMHYADFVSHIFDLYGHARGKPLVGDKTPDYVRNLQTLSTLWPQAKFVHLIRDGRDVALSAINWKRKAGKLASLFRTWGEDPVTTAAFWWEWHVRHGRGAAHWLGSERYYEVRYEALVANPAQECVRLCAFLGLPYQETMLHFHEGRMRVNAGLDAKNAWLPITTGLRNWSAEMAAVDLQRFEHAVGVLLDELSYPRIAAPFGLETRQRVAEVQKTFNEDAERLGDLLP